MNKLVLDAYSTKMRIIVKETCTGNGRESTSHYQERSMNRLRIS
jgi:hypothetical protein